MKAFHHHVEPGGEHGPSQAMRQAALTLHGMNPEDRRWVMACLPRAQQDKLESLLTELDAIAFPCDGSIVQDALRLAQPAQAPSPSPGT